MAIEVRLKEVRKKRGLTQLQLAYKLGMTPQNVQKIENDVSKTISKDTLDKLCRILDCTPGDIFVYLPDKAIAN
ncbi:MAG: helix-turn-helix domain-containing protein [Pleurocapsa sp. MO_226.B13]|nr:helix-turn-helix domain-containing protein [Pleurocapsa sp. MO_226.B13]